MSKRVCLVGAGSAQFGFGMLGDIMQSEILRDSAVVLHDINSANMQRVADAGRTFAAKYGIPCTIEATTDRLTALAQADFVIISIEVGDRFRLWDLDRTIPQQFGFDQIYGENGGPGGIFHSLRIIPPILEICEDIMRVCSGATVFCYSNPMTAISTTVHRRFPELTFVGMCHEIASLRRYLPEILKTDFENLDLVAGGLNHFSCLLDARYRDTGVDAYGDIRENAPGFFFSEPGYSDIWRAVQANPKLAFAEGSERQTALESLVSSRAWSDRGVFKVILEEFDLLPITVDSHFGEYVGWAEQVADHRGILDFLAFYEHMLTRLEPEIKLELSERVVPIMEGIITDSGYVEAAVNLPNDGLITELPSFLAVEVPGHISAKGVTGIPVSPIPKGFAALLRSYAGVYDLTAEAVIQRSKQHAIQAIIANPVVPKINKVRELVDLMISLQPEWLGYLE